MNLTESQIINKTETFFFNDDIYCITDVKNVKKRNGDNYYVYTAVNCNSDSMTTRVFFYNEITNG